jgi:hypothetical protein
VIHSQKEQRYKCRQCGKTFAQRKGSAFYRLRTPVETVTLVVTLLAHGCPVQAIVAAFGFDERTVASWLGRAGKQCQAVHEHLVEQPRDLGQVQADELRVLRAGRHLLDGHGAVCALAAVAWRRSQPSAELALDPAARRAGTPLCRHQSGAAVLYRRACLLAERHQEGVPRPTTQWPQGPATAGVLASCAHRPGA